MQLSLLAVVQRGSHARNNQFKDSKSLRQPSQNNRKLVAPGSSLKSTYRRADLMASEGANPSSLPLAQPPQSAPDALQIRNQPAAFAQPPATGMPSFANVLLASPARCASVRPYCCVSCVNQAAHQDASWPHAQAVNIKQSLDGAAAAGKGRLLSHHVCRVHSFPGERACPLHGIHVPCVLSSCCRWVDCTYMLLLPDILTC